MEPAIPVTDTTSAGQGQLRELVRRPSFLIGTVIILVWLACAAMPGLFTKWTEQDLVRNSQGFSMSRARPQADAWFGTDSIGRDVFARVIYGADLTIVPTLLVASLAVVTGATTALLMGSSVSRADGMWWSAFFPALAITSVALAANLIAGAARKEYLGAGA